MCEMFFLWLCSLFLFFCWLAYKTSKHFIPCFAISDTDIQATLYMDGLNQLCPIVLITSSLRCESVSGREEQSRAEKTTRNAFTKRRWESLYMDANQGLIGQSKWKYFYLNMSLLMMTMINGCCYREVWLKMLRLTGYNIMLLQLSTIVLVFFI